jgi:dephospho-CoA kinase
VKRNNSIYKIGLTGGIGSGKSVVCKLFQELGIPIIYGDELARTIQENNYEVKNATLKLFGIYAYNEDGTLNRKFISRLVFSHPNLLNKLNAIVHPVVENEILKRCKAFEKKKEPLVIIEAALIYESNFDRLFNAVIVVAANDEERIKRVCNRDGSAPSDVKSRMNAQLPQNEKIKRADFVLFNNGPIEELKTRVKFLHSLFLSLTRGI